MKFRSEYAYDTNKVSDETGLFCKDPSLAIQSQADEADINTIVRRFGVTGQLPQSVRVPLDEDFIDVIDYRTALEMVNEADSAFMKMPAAVRSRFDNDPGAFVDWVSDEANYEEAVKLGLAVAKPALVEPVAPVGGTP